jgi:hypothetical protein
LVSPFHLQRRSTSDGMRDLYQRTVELWARNDLSVLPNNGDLHVIVWFFYMPQSCDMGQTALLPLRRIWHAEDFIRPKNPTASAGFEPANLGYQRPLDHRSHFSLNLQMGETHILIRLLWIYFPLNWEFGSALSKLRNFGGGGGFEHPKPPSHRYATARTCQLELDRTTRNVTRSRDRNTAPGCSVPPRLLLACSSVRGCNKACLSASCRDKMYGNVGRPKT